MEKNIKKLLVITLLLLITLRQVGVGASTLPSNQTYAGNQLRQLGILKGYGDGSLKLENNITREEVATIMVRVFNAEGVNLKGQGKKFTDLSKSHWSYQNIQNAYKLNIIKGYPDSTFKPKNTISKAEVLAIMVNSLGYKQESLEGKWPDNYINKAKELKIIPQDSKIDPDHEATRGEMSLMIWNTLLHKK